MGDRGKGSSAHDGKAGAYQLLAIGLDPQPCAVPGCENRENSRRSIGQRPDIASKKCIDSQYRVARLKKAPDIEKARAIEKLEGPDEQDECRECQDCWQQHAAEVASPVHLFGAVHIDEIDEKQWCGRVFAKCRGGEGNWRREAHA